MGAGSRHMHYICTLDEAKKLVEGREKFWVSDCGCRAGKKGCSRSRMDVCLGFEEDQHSGGTGLRAISMSGVKEIFAEAREKYLVTRPFRNMKNMEETGGICFCCDDCCGYFEDPSQGCDKGEFIEETDMNECTSCGACVEVCYFGARKMENGELVVIRENCYGCGLCVEVCPVDCIKMAVRKQ